MRAVMTVEEAREILGEEESSKLTDEELEKLIWDLDMLAGMTIKAIMNSEMKTPK